MEQNRELALFMNFEELTPDEWGWWTEGPGSSYQVPSHYLKQD